MIVLAWLCQEPEYEADLEQACFLYLVDVWQYTVIYRKTQTNTLFRFQTRRNTFKEKLVDHLKVIYDHCSSWQALKWICHCIGFRQFLTHSSCSNGECFYKFILPFEHVDQDTFMNMVHMALQILGDILSHLKPDRLKISDTRAMKSTPGSLYMLLTLLLGNQYLLEGRWTWWWWETSQTSLENSLHCPGPYVHSKWKQFPHSQVPKNGHYFLPSYRLKRMKKLVDMCHHAGDITGYCVVIKLDNALAKRH